MDDDGGKMIEIIEAQRKHYDDIWGIFHDVVKLGDTYIYPPETIKEEAIEIWCRDHVKTYVALVNNHVVGTYVMKPNFVGLG